jgi:hypothetical protein
MTQTKEHWENEVKQAEERLEKIKEIEVQQSIAEDIQIEILNYSKKRLSEFPATPANTKDI